MEKEIILKRYAMAAAGVCVLAGIEAYYAHNALHMLGGLFAAGGVFTIGCLHELTHGDEPLGPDGEQPPAMPPAIRQPK